MGARRRLLACGVCEPPSKDSLPSDGKALARGFLALGLDELEAARAELARELRVDPTTEGGREGGAMRFRVRGVQHSPARKPSVLVRSEAGRSACVPLPSTVTSLTGHKVTFFVPFLRGDPDLAPPHAQHTPH